MMIFYYVYVACACFGLVAFLFAWRSHCKAERQYAADVLRWAYMPGLIHQYWECKPSVLLTMARKKMAR